MKVKENRLKREWGSKKMGKNERADVRQKIIMHE